MADFNYPENPVLDQEHTENGVVYFWNGYGWQLRGDPLDPLYVNVSGDSMTGPLVLPGDPTQPNEAATKAYVDAQTGSVPIAFSFSGKPAAGAAAVIPVVWDTVVPANLAGSVGRVGGAGSAATVTFNVSALSDAGTVTIGTITVTGLTVTFSGEGTTLEVGDALRVTAPATQDATLSDVGFTILTERVV
jgi:hypothetical protein